MSAKPKLNTLKPKFECIPVGFQPISIDMIMFKINNKNIFDNYL